MTESREGNSGGNTAMEVVSWKLKTKSSQELLPGAIEHGAWPGPPAERRCLGVAVLWKLVAAWGDQPARRASKNDRQSPRFSQ